jgi:hypothetical protein
MIREMKSDMCTDLKLDDLFLTASRPYQEICLMKNLVQDSVASALLWPQPPLPLEWARQSRDEMDATTTGKQNIQAEAQAEAVREAWGSYQVTGPIQPKLRHLGPLRTWSLKDNHYQSRLYLATRLMRLHETVAIKR